MVRNRTSLNADLCSGPPLITPKGYQRSPCTSSASALCWLCAPLTADSGYHTEQKWEHRFRRQAEHYAQAAAEQHRLQCFSVRTSTFRLTARFCTLTSTV